MSTQLGLKNKLCKYLQFKFRNQGVNIKKSQKKYKVISELI